MHAVMPLNDLKYIAQLCADPYIARVGHDHRPAAPIKHPDVSYLAATVAGERVGAFCLIRDFIAVDVHALLTRRALRWCRELGRACLAWVFSDPQVARVSAHVIEGLDSARNYCLRLGFKAEGFQRDACMQGGRLVGVHMLGMTRNDWSAA